MRLEAEDPHTSVTFVSLAATGARTDDLFRPDQTGQNLALGPGPVLPAQLKELRDITGSRPVDILVLSIGFNDGRCFDLISEMLRQDIRYVDPLRLLASHPTPASWDGASPEVKELVGPSELELLEGMDAGTRRKAIANDVSLIYDLDAKARVGLDVVRTQLERLREEFARDPRLARADIYLLEYPDPTRVASGETAKAILDDLVPGLRLNRRELDFTRERILRPLNQSRCEAIRRFGWNHVDGVFEAFGCHGYAASDGWFVRAKESEERQGPRLGLVGYLRGEFSPGMLHPNERGQEALAGCLYRSHLSKAILTDRP
jgi:hypothetical protein